MDLSALGSVQENISRAIAHRCCSLVTGENVTLVAVTKNHPPELIDDVLDAGISDVGENRVQEARHKQEFLGSACRDGTRWHLLGHLQSNKVRQAVACFDLIESVDSLRLLQLLNDEAGRIDKIQDVLLQLNIAHESQKSGFERVDYLEVLNHLAEFSHVRVRGLMVIAPAAEDAELVRPVFAAGYRAFVRLKERWPVDILSMGMSNDYMVAVEEGANQVRVGRALFGERDYSIKF